MMKNGMTKPELLDNVASHVPVGMTSATHISEVAREAGVTVDEALSALTADLRKNEHVFLHTADGRWFVPQSPEEIMQFIEKHGLQLFVETVNQWRAYRIQKQYF